MKRILKYLLLIYVGINLVAGYLFWHRIDQFLRFMPRIAPAEFSAPQNDTEAQTQDFSYLENILNYDRSFSDHAKDKFRDRLQSAKAQAGKLSKSAFYLTVRELMAIADNGHTGAETSPTYQSFNRSGVDLYPFKDGYFIVRAHNQYAYLVGKKLTHIEGRTTEEIITELRFYTGGPDNWRDAQSLNIVRSPELLHAAGLIPNSDRMVITVQSNEGEPQEIELTALPIAEKANYFRHAFMTLLAEPLEDEAGEWVRTLDSSQNSIAHYLDEPSDNVKSTALGDGLYIRSNYLMGSKGFPVKELLQAQLQQTPETGYDFIVLDLRWNPGGDYGNAIPFVSQLKNALKEDGKIYVVTGANTFSAAIVFTALIHQAVPDQIVIIGETMGDRQQFWAERGKSFTLPNSGYWIGYSTGYHDWEKGCKKTHTFCFPPNERHEQDIGELSLDIEIVPTYAQYASGRDVVLEWVLKRETE